MEKIINAEMEMENGDIIALELLPETAPISVQNFVELCNQGFYDGLVFHRVIPGFMIQGGGFAWKNGLVAKKTGAPIKGEFRSNGVQNDLHHAPGVLSMARTNVKDSGTSQFFLCVADCAFLDGEYAGFGRVKSAVDLEKALAISKQKTTSWQYYDDVPVEPVIIKTIKVLMDEQK